MKKLLFVLAATALSVLFTSVKAQAQSSDKPYKEGHVWVVNFIQTKPGMGRVYLKDLSTHWVKLGAAAKAQGLILDYKVFSATPASKTDWNLMLMIEVNNYAALDDLEDKLDALASKLLGSDDVQHASALSRNDMRDNLGGRLVQELIFK
jgi:hypothetical protein